MLWRIRSFANPKPEKSDSFSRLFRLFSGGFLVMVTLAQALVIGWVNEQIPVTTERNDVVHDRCQRPVPWITGRELRGTLPTEWLTQQLLNPELVLPDREQVPAVICCAATPAVLWPVLIAPSVSGQRGTSRVPTRSQCFTCQGPSPPRQAKQKSRGRQHNARLRHIIGLGSQSTRPLRYQPEIHFCSPCRTATDSQPVHPGRSV